MTAFRKGDRVVEKLRGMGFTEETPGVIAYVRKGVAYFDNGPGNDPTGYDAVTGKYVLDDVIGGFTRWIEKAAA